MAAKAHSYWNGHVRLSLVTFPVRLYAAISDTDKIRLHKVERRTFRRIHYQNITDDGGVVEPEDVVKAYEYEKNQYVPIEDDELKKLRVESTHLIDLVQFTEMADIDPIYFDRPFFMVPDSAIAEEAFITLRDSLRESGKVALGQITLANKERIAAIRSLDKGLVLETLRYDYEVRRAGEYFRDIPDRKKISKEQVDLARELIERKTAPFDPAAFRDSYQEGLLEIIDAKLHHRKIKSPPKSKPPANVVNIMDALKRSLAQSDKKPAARKSPPRKKRKAG
jgi:DNA end-binding protein Ku